MIISPHLSTVSPPLNSLRGTRHTPRGVKSTEVGKGALRDESSYAAQAPQRVNRKIALLKRCGLFAEMTPGVEITRACSAEDLQAAYTLVHEVFVERGYCKPQEYGMRLRVFEATPSLATFIARSQGRIVGVLSVVGHTPDCGLPSDRAFKPELDALRDQIPGATFCEWSNQVVASDFRKTNISTELMRCAAAHVIATGYSHSIISVSAVHGGFYDLLGFRQISTERSYSQEVDDPVVAFCLPSDLYLVPDSHKDELSSFVCRFMATENPYLARIGEWETEAKALFRDFASLRKLFGPKSNFLRSCELDAQTALIRQWGPHIFRKVVGSTASGAILAWSSTLNEMIVSAVKARRISPTTKKQSRGWWTSPFTRLGPRKQATVG